MKPIEFEQQNVVYGVGEGDRIPLPAHKSEDGIVSSVWKATLWERIRFLFIGKVWCQQITYDDPVQPQKLIIL